MISKLGDQRYIEVSTICYTYHCALTMATRPCITSASRKRKRLIVLRSLFLVIASGSMKEYGAPGRPLELFVEMKNKMQAQLSLTWKTVAWFRNIRYPSIQLSDRIESSVG